MPRHPGKSHGSHNSKSGRQVRFLFSGGSPLTPGQKDTLAGELRTGAVSVQGGKKQIAKQPRRRRRQPLDPR